MNYREAIDGIILRAEAKFDNPNIGVLANNRIEISTPDNFKYDIEIIINIDINGLTFRFDEHDMDYNDINYLDEFSYCLMVARFIMVEVDKLTVFNESATVKGTVLYELEKYNDDRSAIY